MTATLAGSSAALKILYPKGELPKAVMTKFKALDKLKKSTDFVGESAYVALQHENPQGSSAGFATALGSLYQGTYNRFNLTRVEHFGLARVKGQAAEAAVKNEGALVDLWQNETQGIAMTEMHCNGVYLYGTGDGTLGTTSTGTNGTAITMVAGTNMNYFAIGMRVGAVSATGLSSTVRSGYGRITQINRDPNTRTITASAAWNTFITGLTNGDLLTRAGDEQGAQFGANTASVYTGLAGYVVGGATPGTLFGLNRNVDPVRLSGQALAATAGQSMEDTVVEASALAGFQGVGYPDVLLANNRDIANMKKSMSAKILYDRASSAVGGVSFSKVMIEGENGPIEVVADPLCPRNTALLLDWEAFTLWSLGAAPHIDAFDSNQFLRVSNDNAYEVRFVSYLQLKATNLGPQVIITGFGA